MPRRKPLLDEVELELHKRLKDDPKSIPAGALAKLYETKLKRDELERSEVATEDTRDMFTKIMESGVPPDRKRVLVEEEIGRLRQLILKGEDMLSIIEEARRAG